MIHGIDISAYQPHHDLEAAYSDPDTPMRFCIIKETEGEGWKNQYSPAQWEDLERVVINDVDNGTCFARIIPTMSNELGRKIIEVDARPSDSLVLALQQKKPVFVARAVYDAVEDMTEILERVLKQQNEDEDDDADDEEDENDKPPF